MRELGHDRIDLLKIDIEGAEHRVVRSMLAAGIRPTVLCLEIDQPVRPWTFWRTVRRIRVAGYDLVAVDHWNLTFLRSGAAVGTVPGRARDEHGDSAAAAAADHVRDHRPRRRAVHAPHAPIALPVRSRDHRGRGRGPGRPQHRHA